MKLDLKHFRKVDTDKHHTILEHEKGHQIKIAHQGLSSEYKKELDDLPIHQAKGGSIGNPFKVKKGANSEGSKPAPQAAYTPPKEAKHAYTEPDNQNPSMPDVVLKSMNRQGPPFGPLGPIGGGTEPKYHSPPCINSACKSFGKPHPNCRCYGGKMGMYGGYAEGGEVETFCSKDNPHQEGCEYYKPMFDGGMSNRMFEKPNVEEAPQTLAPQEPQAPPVEEPQPPAQAAPAPQQPSMPQDQPMLSDKGPEVPQTPVEKFQSTKQAKLNDLVQEDQAIASDLNNGHIKPETYHDLFAKKDTLGKIGTLFGLMVGGMGSGLSHQPNLILEMMNREISNDLEAQKQSAGNRQNLLTIAQHNILNRAQSGKINTETATQVYALARAKANRLALHSLAEQVKKYPPGSPQRNAAEQTLGMLNQSVQNENFDILDKAASGAAFYNMMMPQSGGQGSEQDFQKQQVFRKMTGPQGEKMAEDIQERHIPGVPGLASRPVPQHDRDQIAAMKVLDDKSGDLISYIGKHRGSLSPDERKTAAQKAEELVSYYNASINGGVLTEGRLKWLDEQISKNPLSIVNDLLGNRARLKEIKDSNSHRMGLMLDKAGFPRNQQQPQQEGQTIERKDPASGRIVIYDSATKKPLRWK